MRWKAKRLKEESLVAFYGTSRRGVYVKKEAEGEKVFVDVDADFDDYLGERTLQDILYPPENA